VSSFPLEVRLFAALREHAGLERLKLDVPAGTTAAGLMPLVREAAPALGPYLAATRVAVNLEFALEDRVLEPGNDVALIPPVGGG
jgi:molybdopterin synthase catalytic subunit